MVTKIPKACDLVTYWRLVIQDLRGDTINIRKLRSLRQKLGLLHFNDSVQAAEKELRMAQKNKKKCKQQAENLQLEYRSSLAAAKEEEDNIAAAVHIRNLTTQEATRQLFRRIRYIEGRLSNLAITKIVTKKRNGQTQELLKKRSIVEAITKENERKFHQTEGCGQLQRGQLLRDIGILATGPKSDQIFNGRYMFPSAVNSATKSFIRKMSTHIMIKIHRNWNQSLLRNLSPDGRK
jgi:hypothetical protein